MVMLVALAMPSLIANSLALEVVVWLAEALEDNICCSDFQKCTAETAYVFLENITLALVITIRVEEKKEASKNR